jgi:hypothetical protein
MKRNKIWYIGLFSSFIFCAVSTAQETKSDFTFKVKKRQSVENTIIETEKKEISTNKTNLETEKTVPFIVKTPRLISGEFGLMKIENFDAKKYNLENPSFKYVVFSYEIGKNGKIKDFILYKTNSLEIKNVLYESLLGSDWRAAVDNQNQPNDFLYPKQILIAPFNAQHHEDIDH